MSAGHDQVSLLPEEHLLASLSPLWRRRFQLAIQYLQATVDQIPAPTWEQVAEHCAISPYHFHRMFRVVFHETPGQYVKRTRLRLALHLLLDQPSMSVTEVALSCGFSSSQALAKSLRRDLNTSAKVVRQLRNEASLSEFDSLLFRLGQPVVDSEQCLEKSLAEEIVFEVKVFSKQQLYVQRMLLSELWSSELSAEDLQYCTEKKLYILTLVNEMDKPYAEQQLLVGCPVTKTAANFDLVSGMFLCCQVTVNNEIAYAAAWDALYSHFMTCELELSEQDYAIDIIHNPETIINEGSEVTLCLPIKE